MDDVIAFQSAIFPARRGGDPDSSESEAAGVACLEHILTAIRGEDIALKGSPLAEGSGCTAFVVSQGIDIAVHLTWFPLKRTRGQPGDVWTLQTWPSGWVHRMFPPTRRRGDAAARVVSEVVEAVLRKRTAEYSEVRRCTWQDLER